MLSVVENMRNNVWHGYGNTSAVRIGKSRFVYPSQLSYPTPILGYVSSKDQGSLSTADLDSRGLTKCLKELMFFNQSIGGIAS